MLQTCTTVRLRAPPHRFCSCSNVSHVNFRTRGLRRKQGNPMKKLLGIAGVAALMFGASGVAQAGTYVEGSAGVTMIDSLDWNSSSYDMDNGWNAAVAVGSDSLLSGWNVEAEFSYDKMEYSCCNPNNTHEYRLMGNITHDFSMGGFTPYLGAGLGLAWVTYEYSGGESEGDAQAAYQLIGGVRVP